MLNPVHAGAIERALRFLEQEFPAQPSLEQVARVAGLSPFHFQRVFASWTGLSPKRFLQFNVAAWARTQLAAGDASVFDVALDSGLSGGGRLHDLLVAVEALTPGEVKAGGAGLEIAWGCHPTPFGECLLAQTARGVCGLRFTDIHGRAAELENLRHLWPQAELRRRPEETAATVRRIFRRPPRRDGTPLRLLLRGTNFQVKVWEALLRIPEGRVVSYEEVAGAVERPRAVRAVGSAVGDNPVAYLIPCHRVLRKSLALGGYAYGLARKRLILACEAGRSAGRGEPRMSANDSA